MLRAPQAHPHAVPSTRGWHEGHKRGPLLGKVLLNEAAVAEWHAHHAAAPAPAPQMLHEAPAPEHEVTHEEVEWHHHEDEDHHESDWEE